MIERGTLKGRPRERCQKESCHRIRKLEKAVLEAEVKRLRFIELDFNVQVAGHLRAADVLWQPTLRAKDAAEKTAADLLKNNKKHLESAKKLRAERGGLGSVPLGWRRERPGGARERDGGGAVGRRRWRCIWRRWGT